MILRDNADDYLENQHDTLIVQAWAILKDVECPPSREVFDHWYFHDCIELKAALSPPQFAHRIVALYARTDADRKQKQPWYRWSEANGRLVPA